MTAWEDRVPLRVVTLVDRIFDRCNLIGDDCEIWGVMWKYKTIRNLPDVIQEEIYDDIARRLGFMR